MPKWCHNDPKMMPNSPGQRPNGVSDLAPSLLFSSICRLSLILGPPLGPSSHAVTDSVPTRWPLRAIMATLGRPRADFYRFFDAPKRHRKINVFCNRPKSPPELQKSLFGHPRLHFWWIFVNFWCPFWHHFLMFLQNAENLDFGDSSIDFKVFTFPKHLLLASFFHHFSALFVEALLDQLFLDFLSIFNQKCQFLADLAIRLAPKIAPRATIFGPKGAPNHQPRMIRSVRGA